MPLLWLDFGREMGYGNNPYFSFYFTFVLQSVSACAGDLSMLHNQFEISVVTETGGNGDTRSNDNFATLTLGRFCVART